MPAGGRQRRGASAGRHGPHALARWGVAGHSRTWGGAGPGEAGPHVGSVEACEPGARGPLRVALAPPIAPALDGVVRLAASLGSGGAWVEVCTRSRVFQILRHTGSSIDCTGTGRGMAGSLVMRL